MNHPLNPAHGRFEASDGDGRFSENAGVGFSDGSGVRAGTGTGVTDGGKPIGNSYVVVAVQDQLGLEFVGPWGLPRFGF